MVGSEEVDDESYMTQRHEFTLYTQRSGDIVIPAFRVRFSGKKTFTSDPEPMEGTTSELRFKSKRPPGTESMGVVVSATAMKIQQTWNPVPESDIKAGDVIVRTITRNAEGTTAMMLPPVPTDAPEGVRVYSGTPDVQDKVERGDTTRHSHRHHQVSVPAIRSFRSAGTHVYCGGIRSRKGCRANQSRAWKSTLLRPPRQRLRQTRHRPGNHLVGQWR